MDAKTGASVLAEARSWLGTPYEHKAQIKGKGADCGSMIHAVYSKFLILRPFPQDYPSDWTLHRSDELYLNFIQEYVTETAQPVVGGLVVFRIGRCFGHGGIVSDKGVIHAWGRTQRGSVQESKWNFFKEYPVRKYFDVRI
jgi:cell wall-associated NlpC family hydrolase